MGTTPWHRFDGRGDVPPGSAAPAVSSLMRFDPSGTEQRRDLHGRDAIGERAIAHA